MDPGEPRGVGRGVDASVHGPELAAGAGHAGDVVGDGRGQVPERGRVRGRHAVGNGYCFTLKIIRRVQKR